MTHLSANDPNKIFPTKIPNMKIVCDRFGNCACWHTKFHVIWIVSSKTSLLNSYSVQFAEHLSVITGFLHLNSTFGAMKMMLIWCQATGNFSRNITPHTNKCHLPNCPIAFWMGSDACNVLLASGTLLKSLSLLVLPFASISIATIGMKQRIEKKEKKNQTIVLAPSNMALVFQILHIMYALDFRMKRDINKAEIHTRVQFTTTTKTHSKDRLFSRCAHLNWFCHWNRSFRYSIRLPARNLICDTHASNNFVSCRLSSHILVALDTPSPSSPSPSPLFVRQTIPILRQIYCSEHWFIAFKMHSWIFFFFKKKKINTFMYAIETY